MEVRRNYYLKQLIEYIRDGQVKVSDHEDDLYK